MRDLAVLFVYLIATVASLLGRGGARSLGHGLDRATSAAIMIRCSSSIAGKPISAFLTLRVISGGAAPYVDVGAA